MVGAYVVLNSAGALLIKSKVNQLGAANLENFSVMMTYFGNLLLSPKIWIGLSSILIAGMTWVIALSYLDLSLAYPLAVGLNFLVVIGCSFLLYKENAHPYKIIAVALVIFSMYLLSLIPENQQ